MYFCKSLPSDTPAANAPVAIVVFSASVASPVFDASLTSFIIRSESFASPVNPCNCAEAVSIADSRFQPNPPAIPPSANVAPTAGFVILFVKLEPTL